MIDVRLFLTLMWTCFAVTMNSRYVFLYAVLAAANFFWDQSYYPTPEMICIRDHLSADATCSSVDKACFLYKGVAQIINSCAHVVSAGFLGWIMLWLYRCSQVKIKEFDYFLTGFSDSLSLRKAWLQLRNKKVVISACRIFIDNFYAGTWMLFLMFKGAVPLLHTLNDVLRWAGDGCVFSFMRPQLPGLLKAFESDFNILASFEAVFGDRVLYIAVYVLYPLILAAGLIKKKDIATNSVANNTFFAVIGILLIQEEHRARAFDALASITKIIFRGDETIGIAVASLIVNVFVTLWALVYGFLQANGCVLEEYQKLANAYMGRESSSPESTYELLFWLVFTIKTNIYYFLFPLIYDKISNQVLSLNIPFFSLFFGRFFSLLNWIHSNIMCHIVTSLMMSWYFAHFYRMATNQAPSKLYGLVHERWIYFVGFGFPWVLFAFYIDSMFISTFIISRIAFPISVLLLGVGSNSGFKSPEDEHFKDVFECNDQHTYHRFNIFYKTHMLLRKYSNYNEDDDNGETGSCEPQRLLSEKGLQIEEVTGMVIENGVNFFDYWIDFVLSILFVFLNKIFSWIWPPPASLNLEKNTGKTKEE